MEDIVCENIHNIVKDIICENIIIRNKISGFSLQKHCILELCVGYKRKYMVYYECKRKDKKEVVKKVHNFTKVNNMTNLEERLQEIRIKEFNENQQDWINHMYLVGMQTENVYKIDIVIEELQHIVKAIQEDDRVGSVTFDTYNQIQTVIKMLDSHKDYLKFYVK